MTYLDKFLTYVDALPDILVYLAMGISSFVENVFPPAPGDFIIALGAFLVGSHRLNFFGMYISTVLGSAGGFMFLFWIGTVLDRRFLIKKDYRIFSAEKIIRAEAWFRRYGYFLILINRFLPGIRSVISIVAGLSSLQGPKVFLLALASSSAWNLIWIMMGYTVGTNLELTRSRLSALATWYNYTFLGIFGIGVLVFIIVRFIRRATGK